MNNFLRQAKRQALPCSRGTFATRLSSFDGTHPPRPLAELICPTPGEMSFAGGFDLAIGGLMPAKRGFCFPGRGRHQSADSTGGLL
jgi:hypothetical protein